MSTLGLIILASIAESLVSFAAGVAVILAERKARHIVHWVISVAVGVLLGVVFFDLLPETIDRLGAGAFSWVLTGFVGFFVLERFLVWFHRHDSERSVAGHLVLIADGAHNFIDGVIIALAFLVDMRLGAVTTAAILVHEIPQEVGDFTILLHNGYSKKKALVANVAVSLTTIVGALVGYALGGQIGFIGILLAIVAGNFLYLASADLIPELQHEHRAAAAFLQVALVIGGILLIAFFGTLVPE